MTDTELLLEAFRRGSAWNPAFPNLRNLDESRVLKMTMNDRDAKDLMLSRQLSDANFDTLVFAHHKRAPSFDGSVGPATRMLIDLPRCAMPDFPPPPEASFHYDDPDLQAAVESQQRFFEVVGATGSGSFPVPGCDPQRKNRATEHSIVVNVDISNCPASTLAKIDDIIDFCRKCAAEFGLSARYVKAGVKGPTHWFNYGSLPGSTIGYNYFPTPGTCNQTVTGKIDTGFSASTIVEAGLWVHEHQGHGCGLNHTRGGIMNPSINTINPLSWRGDPAESTIKRYWGGESVPLDDVTPPPSTHPAIIGKLFAETFTGGIAIRGEVELSLKSDHPAGSYKYIAAPDSTGSYKIIPKPSV
jgi:hypothetical protein